MRGPVRWCFYILSLILLALPSKAQDKGQFSGHLQLNANAFLEDESIGATNTPQYEEQIFGMEAWLDLGYLWKGFDFGLRLDYFKNSNLLNPRDSYSDQGIGRWHIRKQFGSLNVQLGSIYDQVGSGIIFRAYEERPLLIDNALQGLSLKYNLWDQIEIKAFAGRQKNLFDTYSSWVKGGTIEGLLSFGEDNTVTLVPGAALVNRTWSDRQVDQIINTLKTYTPADSIGFFYHNWSFSLYNTLSAGPLIWYAEAAFKYRDIYFDAEADRLLYTGESTLGKFRNDNGQVYYTSLSYGVKGLGATVEYKRTENFTYRADPFAALNRGLVNFLPPMSRLNTFRLKSRYNPATQEISEQAFQLELRYALSKKWKLVQYFANITDLDGDLLYREFDMELQFRKDRNLQWKLGLQGQTYNQAVYEGKSGVPLVQTVIPYLEWFRKFDRRKSLRLEAQYMSSEEDFGSWLFGLAEFSIAPKWSFSISDMYNVRPTKTDDIHYPRVDIVCNIKRNRLMISYIKQVEGVVCAGGICRLEPAFSGVRFNLISTI